MEEVRATGATSTIHCAACGKWLSHAPGMALVRCPCGVVITVTRATHPEETPRDAELLRQITDFEVKLVVDRITEAQLEAERTRFAEMLAAQSIVDPGPSRSTSELSSPTKAMTRTKSQKATDATLMAAAAAIAT